MSKESDVDGLKASMASLEARLSNPRYIRVCPPEVIRSAREAIAMAEKYLEHEKQKIEAKGLDDS